MALSFNFVTILGAGKLALSERPKIKEVKKLVPVGCNRVVTILSAKGEQAHKIGEAVELCGMEWDWLKISNATGFSAEEERLFKSSINKIYRSILNGENVLVHCSAGLHRTGMFVYALLRKGGVGHEESLKTIQEIRIETYEALEEKYIDLASKLY